MNPPLRASSTSAARRMRQVRRRDTKPELAIRKLLHSTGLRYRVDFAPLADSRRRADIVFTKQHVAVFVDGCFWHSCPEHATQPKSNSAWWRKKLEDNVTRDRDTDRMLEDAGWTVLRVWEHEDPQSAALAIAEVVYGQTSALPRPRECSSSCRNPEQADPSPASLVAWPEA